MAEIVDFEAARWADWASYAKRRAARFGTTYEEEIAKGLQLRANLRAMGCKVSAPFWCEQSNEPPPRPLPTYRLKEGE